MSLCASVSGSMGATILQRRQLARRRDLGARGKAMGGCTVTSQTGRVQPLPELRAPVAKAPHIGMGCGLVPARAGERMWQSSGMPILGGGSASSLPKGPGLWGTRRYEAKISAWDAKGSERTIPPHAQLPRKGSVLGAPERSQDE